MLTFLTAGEKIIITGFLMGMDVSVVFAARDEEGNIRPLHAGIRKALGQSCEIVGVDDGSEDRTLSEMRSIEDPNFRVMSLKKGAGKCRALYEGMAAASGDVIVTMDSDLQEDSCDIPRMLDLISRGSDFVCGWRKERADGPWRAAQSRIGNALNNALLGVGLHDSNCPLKAFRRECVSGIAYFRNCHRFLPALAMRQGFSVREIPVSHRMRVRGKSKYGFSGRIIGNAKSVFMVKFRWRDLLHESEKQGVQVEMHI